MNRQRRDPDHEIWDAETERDNPEPLSDGETQGREDSYERGMWGDL